jgi:SPP1 gp7 family putative phage head morphogenesis protein
MLNKQFTRQEKDVLKSLKEKSFTFDFDVDEEEGIFVKMFNPYMQDIVTAYGMDAMEMVDSQSFSLSARAKDWIRKNVTNFSGEINKTTQDKIRKALEVSVDEGEGIEQAQRRIRTVFKEATTSRARAIARTEIQHSSNYASVEAWKQSEVVSGKEWLTAFDEATCPECEALDGKTVGLDSEFPVDDDLFADAEEPPAHVNCRCTLIPVIKEKNMVIADIKAKEIEANKHIAESKKLLSDTREALEDTKKVIKNINEVITDEQEDK